MALPAVTFAQDRPRSPIETADRDLYVGWLAFRNYCARCHGFDAQGSEFAPGLPERMRRMEQRDFVALMEGGYPGLEQRMAPWGRDPVVKTYYDPLWAYLAARARGELPPGDLAYTPGRD